MYELTLTALERIELQDLSGDVVELLLQCDYIGDWHERDDVVMPLPENVCWDISDELRQIGWSELSKDLADKLQNLIDAVDLGD